MSKKLYVRRTRTGFFATVSEDEPAWDPRSQDWVPVSATFPELCRAAPQEGTTIAFELGEPKVVGPRFKVRHDGGILCVVNTRTGRYVETWTATNIGSDRCPHCGGPQEWGFRLKDERAAKDLCEQLNKTCYKIVCKTNDWGVFRSLIADLQYHLGERTVPYEGTGLLAFGDLETAQLFMNSYKAQYAILAGYGPLGPKLPAGAMDLILKPGPEIVQQHWNTGMYSIAPWPQGTISLGWFVPEEVVEC